MNVLFVENHARFARIAVRTFFTSHVVTIVPSLAAARRALAAQPFELVLLDYDLDDGKGDALLRELRGQSNRPWVIAASAHEAGNEALRLAGADAVCAKAEFPRLESILAALANGVSP